MSDLAAARKEDPLAAPRELAERYIAAMRANPNDADTTAYTFARALLSALDALEAANKERDQLKSWINQRRPPALTPVSEPQKDTA